MRIFDWRFSTSDCQCRRKAAAFTLIETLVAIAVLAMVAVIFTSMIGGVSSVWNRSREKMDNFGKGRALLNHLQRELQNAVLREDLPAFPGGDFAFYTRSMSQDGASLSDDARPLTFVEYVNANDSTGKLILKRIDQPYLYANSPAWMSSAVNTAPSSGATLSRRLCEGVYAFRHAFLDTGGGARPLFDKTSGNPPKAVQVSMVVLSEQAEDLLEAASLRTALETVVNDLPAPAAGEGWSPKAIWDEKLARANLPARLLAGIRTFERVIPISYETYESPNLTASP